MSSEVWDPKKCKQNCQNGNFSLSLWNRWVATNIHLDKSSTCLEVAGILIINEGNIWLKYFSFSVASIFILDSSKTRTVRDLSAPNFLVKAV
jgi:hypothetical protein